MTLFIMIFIFSKQAELSFIHLLVISSFFSCLYCCILSTKKEKRTSLSGIASVLLDLRYTRDCLVREILWPFSSTFWWPLSTHITLCRHTVYTLNLLARSFNMTSWRGQLLWPDLRCRQKKTRGSAQVSDQGASLGMCDIQRNGGFWLSLQASYSLIQPNCCSCHLLRPIDLSVWQGFLYQVCVASPPLPHQPPCPFVVKVCFVSFSLEDQCPVIW